MKIEFKCSLFTLYTHRCECLIVYVYDLERSTHVRNMYVIEFMRTLVLHNLYERPYRWWFSREIYTIHTHIWDLTHAHTLTHVYVTVVDKRKMARKWWCVCYLHTQNILWWTEMEMMMETNEVQRKKKYGKEKRKSHQLVFPSIQMGNSFGKVSFFFTC